MEADDRTIAQIIDVASSTKYPTTRLSKNKKYAHLNDYILKWTQHLPDIPYSARIYYAVNKLVDYVKCVTPGCDNDVRHDVEYKKPFDVPVNFHCCASCAQKDPKTQAAISKTSMERHGCMHPSQSLQSREKVRAAAKSRTDDERNAINKKREKTCEHLYGVKNVSQHKELKKKAAETFKNRPEEEKRKSLEHSRHIRLERYGDYCNGKKISETRKSFSKQKNAEINEKRLKTVLRDYGVKCVLNTEELMQKAAEARLSKSYDTSVTHDRHVEPMFTKDYFLEHHFEELQWRCKKCGKVFMSKIRQHYSHTLVCIARCLDCYPLHGRNSSIESRLTRFVESLDAGTVVHNARDVIPPKELDIYVPSKKLAIEFNGIRWHSLEMCTPYDYHFQKTNECEAKGVFLLHVFENEWLHNRRVVEGCIKMLLGIYDRNVDTADCEVVELHKDEYDAFYDANSFVWHDDVQTIGLKHRSEVVFCCQIDANDEHAVLKNFVSRLGVDVKDALDACVSYASRFNRTIQLLVDRRIMPVPAISSYAASTCEMLSPEKLFYSSAHKKVLVPQRNEAALSKVDFTLMDSGSMMLKVNT